MLADERRVGGGRADQREGGREKGRESEGGRDGWMDGELEVEGGLLAQTPPTHTENTPPCFNAETMLTQGGRGVMEGVKHGESEKRWEEGERER